MSGCLAGELLILPTGGHIDLDERIMRHAPINSLIAFYPLDAINVIFRISATPYEIRTDAKITSSGHARDK